MTTGRSKIIIATDASCIKNDIKKGAGHTTCAFVVTENGLVIKEKTEYLGIRTISEAEYYGVIRALEYIKHCKKVADFIIYSDSEFIVKQLNQEYAVKAENMIPLYARAMELLTSNITILHHPREAILGKLVDYLAHNLCLEYKGIGY